MTSITVAPRPMRNAHRKPRRAPSLRMDKLIGPTGMERRKPLIKPVRAARRIGGRLYILFFFFFDFVANFAGDTRTDEAVNEVQREHGGQDVIEDFLAQDEDQAEDQRRDE